MQEIRYLARLKSEYIVTYNHSWVEVNLKEEITEKTDKNFTHEIEDECDDEDDYVFNPWRKDVGDSIYYSSMNKSESSIEFYRSETEEKKESSREMKTAIEKNLRKNELKNSSEQKLLIGNKTFM